MRQPPRAHRSISAGRVVLAALLGLIGLVVGIIAALPDALRTALGFQIGALATETEAIDPRLWFGLAGAICILLALAAIFLRRRTPQAQPSAAYQQRAPRPAYAPVALYYDYENQAISRSMVPIFVAFIHEHLHGQRADMFFYADATSHKSTDGLRDIFHRLSAHQFKQIDVPHYDLSDERNNISNMADRIMSMHILERALTADRPLHFILITEDRGFASLIYHIQALGHHVSVWARDIPPTYQRISQMAPLTTLAFGTRFDSGSKPYVGKALTNPLMPRSLPSKFIPTVDLPPGDAEGPS